jgi:30S ribosomal protein S31
MGLSTITRHFRQSLFYACKREQTAHGIKAKLYLKSRTAQTAFSRLRMYGLLSEIIKTNSIMGKGDKKSRKGKIVKGTYGNRRPRKANKPKTEDQKKEAAAAS